MRSINYQSLVNVMRHEKPYRGSTNRYPLFSRRENRKFFLHETDSNGEPFMRIVYGYSWSSVDVTEEEYKAHKDDKDGCYSEYPLSNWDEKAHNYVEYGKKWIRHEKTPHELGIVRPDNSFEFTRDRYWQGDQMFLSAISPGTFFTDSRRGGSVYGNRRNSVMYPIYQGLRIDCDTMNPDPSREYRLVGMRVDRKKAKEILGPYEDFFLTAKAMMKVMPVGTFYEIGKEVLEANNIETKYWLTTDSRLLMRKRFEELMNDSPVDAVAAYCLAKSDSRGLSDYYHTVTRNDKYDFNTNGETAERYFDIVKRYITKEIYKSNADLMKQVEFEFGKIYPPSEWPYELYVNGEEVDICN